MNTGDRTLPPRLAPAPAGRSRDGPHDSRRPDARLRRAPKPSSEELLQSTTVGDERFHRRATRLNAPAWAWCAGEKLRPCRRCPAAPAGAQAVRPLGTTCSLHYRRVLYLGLFAPRSLPASGNIEPSWRAADPRSPGRHHYRKPCFPVFGLVSLSGRHKHQHHRRIPGIVDATSRAGR